MLRVAELAGSLSLATDLADGFTLEKCLRTSVVATRLARAWSSDAEVARLSFWSTLLRFVGCTAFAHEEARDFSAGDDISLRRALAMVDFGRPATFVREVARGVAPTASFGQRVRAVGRLLSSPSAPRRHADAQCEAGMAIANALGMPDVGEVLRFREERWDGRGPRAVAAETALPLAARIADVADVAELFAWNFGVGVAHDELRRRRGGSLDPALVDRFLATSGDMFAELFATSAWEVFLEVEPAPLLTVEEEAVTRILEAFSRVADVASVFTLGHSLRVAEVAHTAALAAGLDAATARVARHAGLTHELGRVGVPIGIWEKREPLTPFERERIRTHSQHTETVLRLAPALAEVAETASMTHERGTGGGYHRRLRDRDLSPVARALAAADVLVALESDRPHRSKLARVEVERELRAMARSGALDARSVDAVLAATGSRRTRRTNVRGLTEREIEVVRLVAIGRTNPEIGALLGMSPRTAQRHVMNVYEKLGVESRAGLALFAVENDLLD